jgi:hypothetical protein
MHSLVAVAILPLLLLACYASTCTGTDTHPTNAPAPAVRSRQASRQLGLEYLDTLRASLEYMAASGNGSTSSTSTSTSSGRTSGRAGRTPAPRPGASASQQQQQQQQQQQFPPLLRPGRIAVGEAHIVHKLYASLRALLGSSGTSTSSTSTSTSSTSTSSTSSTSSSDSSDLHALISNGYQCTPHEQTQQRLLSRRVAFSLCSEIEWYKLAALSAPHMTTIVDVGSNKGLLSALFLSLWGGGGGGAVSPRTVYDIEAATGHVKTVVGEGAGAGPGPGKKARVEGRLAGYCQYGENEGTPLLPPDKLQRLMNGQGQGPGQGQGQGHSQGQGHGQGRGGVTVYSFDGSSAVARMTDEVISQLASREYARAHTSTSNTNTNPNTKVNANTNDNTNPNANGNAKGNEVGPSLRWVHTHAALSSLPGQANFTTHTAAEAGRGNNGYEGKVGVGV